VDFVAVDDMPTVLADPVQLEQVLFNLCINARDAIQGAGFIRVRLGWHRGPWRCASCRAAGEEASWVELSVADSGTGIATDVLECIFEPFVSTKEVGRGSGMGLAMVHGIVHDHGGHVLLETLPGAGTVFRVVLPPAGADVAADASATHSASVDTGQALRGRVLVVEDEAMVGDFMAELLTSWGLEVVLRRDPLSALAWLEDRENAVDLLITDQTMPQLAGLALAQRATSVRAGLPVLLYSGNAEDFDAAELERSGVRGAIRKPVDAEMLRALVARWLRGA
jgi:CheY-like chemotaxis protein